MRRRAMGIVAVVVVVGAAVVYGKACSGQGGGPSAASSQAAPEASGAGRPASGPVGSVAARTQPVGSSSAQAGEDPSKPEVVFSAAWGGGKGQLGRERPTEGNPEGPMSLSLDGSGRIYVLDQVNGRVVRYTADGKQDSTIPITQQAAQDIATGKDGSMAVLDRFTSKSVSVFDAKGNFRGDIPLAGDGIEEPGEVTGVVVDGDEVYAEREHGPLVLLGSVSGAPADKREEIPGRPSRDGLSFLKAGIIDGEAGRVYVSSVERSSMKHRFTRELRMEGAARTIQLLDTDKSGVIYFAVVLDRPDGGEAVYLSCMEPLQGNPMGSAWLPVNTMPEESFRDFAVQDEGGVIFALRTEQGVSYQRVDCK